MLYNDLLKIAYQSLRAHKSRAFLTTLGIIVGVSAVIIVMSVGAGAQSLIINQIKGVGSNLLAVFPGATEENAPPASAMGISITTLTYDDAVSLKNKSQAPHIIGSAPQVQGIATVSRKNRKLDITFLGVSSDYIVVENADVSSGRFITSNEEKNLNRVVVLGQEVKDNLFGDQDPLGETIKIKKEQFTVIGVMASRGVSGFSNRDNQIFIPIFTAQKILLGINHITLLRLKVDEIANIPESIEDVSAILRARHHITDSAKDDFSVRSQEQFMNALLSITNAVKFFLASIAAIALIVGGIGIMNIMLVSVSERIEEIGLRKSLGASEKDISQQFLLEAILITFLGGALGIIFGSVVALIVALIARYLGYDWDLVISFSSILLGLVVSILIGLIFGFYPAKKAARMDPIEALSYE